MFPLYQSHAMNDQSNRATSNALEQADIDIRDRKLRTERLLENIVKKNTIMINKNLWYKSSIQDMEQHEIYAVAN